MSYQKIKNFITRLTTDAEFRKKFFETKNREKFLKGFSKEEKEVLVKLTPERVEKFATSNKVVFSDIRI